MFQSFAFIFYPSRRGNAAAHVILSDILTQVIRIKKLG